MSTAISPTGATEATSGVDLDRPVAIISADTHIGPRLVQELRAYCPADLLDAYDDYATATAAHNATIPPGGFFGLGRTAFIAQHAKNLQTDGHHDMDTRLRDLDRDGVAAEVIFHGSMNDEPIPFSEPGFFVGSFLGDRLPDARKLEMLTIGVHMYNQWLADVVSIQPERQIGCAQVPHWDVEATVREIVWAKEAGLRSINWPTARVGLMEFDDPRWEPVWAACADADLPLTTHCGAIVPGLFSRDPREVPHAMALIQMESGGWPGRRGMQRMVLSGVFERYPNLRMVLTEQAGGWWRYSMREMDSSYYDNLDLLEPTLPMPPSEYYRRNIFIGASFISADEASEAVEQGYAANVMWGNDYPHPEGTWAADELDRTRLHLRYAFAGLPPAEVRAMLSDNAVRVYGLDAEALQRVAERIDAPSLRELSEPIDEYPTSYGKAFRRNGPWS